MWRSNVMWGFPYGCRMVICHCCVNMLRNSLLNSWWIMIFPMNMYGHMLRYTVYCSNFRHAHIWCLKRAYIYIDISHHSMTLGLSKEWEKTKVLSLRSSLSAFHGYKMGLHLPISDTCWWYSPIISPLYPRSKVRLYPINRGRSHF